MWVLRVVCYMPDPRKEWTFIINIVEGFADVLNVFFFRECESIPRVLDVFVLLHAGLCTDACME